MKKAGYLAGLVGIALANQGCLTYAMSLGASNPYVSPRTRALCRVAADTNRSLDNSNQNYRLDRLESGRNDKGYNEREEKMTLVYEGKEEDLVVWRRRLYVLGDGVFRYATVEDVERIRKKQEKEYE